MEADDAIRPVEEDMEKTTLWPPHRFAFQELLKGELDYEAVIPWERFEELLGFKREGRTEWNFRNEWIALSVLVKEAGFIFTERHMEGKGVKVMERKRMAEHVRMRENAKANESLRFSTMLSMVPREGLERLVVKKLDHWETKAAVLGATAKVLLRKRNLPTPDMAVKSVKQLMQPDPRKDAAK